MKFVSKSFWPWLFLLLLGCSTTPTEVLVVSPTKTITSVPTKVVFLPTTDADADTPTLRASSTATQASETPIPTETVTPTVSNTPTATRTLTPTITLTATLTNQPFEVLIYCVNSLYANTINVRSGPSTTYPRLGEPLAVNNCLTFRATNEDQTWLLIAPNQTNLELRPKGMELGTSMMGMIFLRRDMACIYSLRTHSDSREAGVNTTSIY